MQGCIMLTFNLLYVENGKEINQLNEETEVVTSLCNRMGWLPGMINKR